MEQIDNSAQFVTFGVKPDLNPCPSNNTPIVSSNSTHTTNISSSPFKNSVLLPPVKLAEDPENRFGLDYFLVKYFLSNKEDPTISNEKLSELKNLIPDFDFEKNLKLDVKAPCQAYRLNPEANQKIPLKINLKAMDISIEFEKLLENRSGIDLICVVDVSGSMKGENKINLVKETLQTMISMMTEYDRLALIIFNHEGKKVFPLRQISQINGPMFSEFIGALTANGGTNINEGVKLAMDIIKNRKYRNPITSVFLLSDGQDQINRSLPLIQETMNSIDEKESFTVHSFGFGKDHDADLMREIAKTKGGNFYFVDDLKIIDECFMDTMGLLFSAILKDVEIHVTVNNNGFLNDMRIKKTFGEMWSFNENKKQHTIKAKLFTIGMTKDYICTLNLPPIKKILEENEKKQVVVKVTMEGFSVKDDKKLTKETEYSLNFLNFDEVLEENVVDSDVIVNFLRVKGAEKLENAKNYCDKHMYEMAQKELQKIKNKILKSPFKDYPPLMILLENVEKTITFCQKEKYNNEGKSYVSSYSHHNMYQQSCPNSRVGNVVNYYATNLQKSSNQSAMEKKNQG